MPTDLRSHLIIVASFFRYCLGGKKNVRPRSLDRVPVGPSQIRKLGNQCQDTSGLECDQTRGKGLPDVYNAVSNVPDFAVGIATATSVCRAIAPSQVFASRFYAHDDR